MGRAVLHVATEFLPTLFPLIPPTCKIVGSVDSRDCIGLLLEADEIRDGDALIGIVTVDGLSMKMTIERRDGLRGG